MFEASRGYWHHRDDDGRSLCDDECVEGALDPPRLPDETVVCRTGDSTCREAVADEAWELAGADQEELRDGALDGDEVKIRAGIAGRAVTADDRQPVLWLVTVAGAEAGACGRV